MSDADLDARFARDAALLAQARTISMNKSFFLLFFICFLISAVGLLVIAVSGLWGWVTVGVLLAVGAAGVFSGKMDELMTLGTAGISAVTGIVSIAVTAYLVLGLGH